jgi:malate dehydrogenase (oxaloacetate-decarboxylating)
VRFLALHLQSRRSLTLPSHFDRAIDADGLLLTDTENLRQGQEKYARDSEEVKEWKKGEKGYELLETIKRVKPSVLIGVSTQKEAFTEEVSTSPAVFSEQTGS